MAVSDSNEKGTKPGKGMTVQQCKVYITLGILIIGVILGAVASSLTTEGSQNHANGLIIDFEEYDVTWFPYDLNSCSDPVELLKKACEKNGFTYDITDGKLTSVNGISNTDSTIWDLWYVNFDSTTWVRSSNYSIDAKNYSAVAWAYRSITGTPTVAVDSTGVCVYGYPQAERIVTLSPVATETVGALNATSCIIGTDYYSNYPNSINDKKSTGAIQNVGTYTDPSYELIMKQNPDIVIADGTQYNQIQIAKSVRKANINAVTLYEGEDLRTIYNNTYLTGVAIGYELTALKIIENDKKAIDDLVKKILPSEIDSKKVMVALSPDASPYVAGNYTYMNDILKTISAENAFGSMNGWAHANTETIATNNPDIIIIITESYQPTQEEWDIMYSNLSDTWKRTNAYANKEIYMLCNKAVDLASRSSPRFPQIAELVCDIIYPESFGSDSIPKYIGDEYSKYLTITKYLGYDN